MDSARHFMRDMKRLINRHVSDIIQSEYSMKFHTQEFFIGMIERRAVQRMKFAEELNLRTRILGEESVTSIISLHPVLRIPEPDITYYIQADNDLVKEYDQILGRAYLGGVLKEMILKQRRIILIGIKEMNAFEIKSQEVTPQEL